MAADRPATADADRFWQRRERDRAARHRALATRDLEDWVGEWDRWAERERATAGATRDLAAAGNAAAARSTAALDAAVALVRDGQVAPALAELARRRSAPAPAGAGDAPLALPALLARFGPRLKPTGGKWVADCPFCVEDHRRHLYVYPDGWCHCFKCLAAHEPVWTAAGLRPIGTLTPGDLVLDHRGALRPVTAVMHQRGPLLALHAAGCRRDPLLVTPDHTCLFVRGRRRGGVRRPPRIIEGPAHALQAGDFLVFPVIPPEERRVLGPSSPIRPYTSGPVVARIEELPLDEDACWLYGLWLAEGSCYRGGVAFSLASHEGAIAERVATIVWARFHVRATIRPVATEHLLHVTCSKTDLAVHFRAWFGTGAAGKRLPAEVLRWPEGLQRALIAGYLAGDGAIARPVATTVSPQLAYGLFALATQCGERPTLSRREPRSRDGSVRRPHWVLALKREEGVSGRYLDIAGARYYAMAIVRVEHLGGDHAVVDIAVEGAHTFTAKFAAVHNCGSHVSYAALAAAWSAPDAP